MNGSDAVKRIAVIGARGFIGNNLVNALKKEDYDVIDLPDVDICILETLNLKDVDLVYHLAAYPLTNCKKNYHDCIKTNILGTINLMEAVKKYKIKRVIYSSASSVYGNPMSLPVHEDAQKTPLTLYGVCKLASEQIIHYYFVSPPKRVVLPIANKCISTNLPIFYCILHALETMNYPFSNNYLYNQMSKTFLLQSVPQVMAS
jgi:nucleoside-diphosphate-sugar epimerase